MKLKVLLITVSIVFSCLSISFAEEKITLSTFYPAPYGDYDELTADSFAANKAVIGPTYPFPTNDGDLIVEGNVGIGTTAPNSLLSFGIAGAGKDIVYLYDDGATQYGLGINHSELNMFAGWTGNINFRSGVITSGVGTSLLYLKFDGNVGIGTAEPATKLTISSNAGGLDAVLLKLANTGAGASGSGIEFGGTYVGSASEDYAMSNAKIVGHTLNATTRKGNLTFFTRDGSMIPRMLINEVGNVGIGTLTPSYKLDVNGSIRGFGITDSSDVRWKKNITTLGKPLDKIAQLRGARYEWNREDYPDKDFAQGPQIGIIAQELEAQYPELIDTDKDGYKSIQYGKFTAVLLEAIKSQQGEINTLKARVDALEAE